LHIGARILGQEIDNGHEAFRQTQLPLVGPEVQYR